MWKQSENKLNRNSLESEYIGITHDIWEKFNHWYRDNGRHYLPWRKNRTPWSILMAETLLRRTRADTVARVFPVIISNFSNASAVLSRREEWLEATVELGLKSRFDDFFRTCKIVQEDYNNHIPSEEKELMLLPGIGHYSSDAIRCFGFNESRYLVDTNTLRIASRLTGVEYQQEKHRSKAARGLLKKAFGPESRMTADINFGLLDFANLVCKTNTPDCMSCPFSSICIFHLKNIH